MHSTRTLVLHDLVFLKMCGVYGTGLSSRGYSRHIARQESVWVCTRPAGLFSVLILWSSLCLTEVQHHDEVIDAPEQRRGSTTSSQITPKDSSIVVVMCIILHTIESRSTGSRQVGREKDDRVSTVRGTHRRGADIQYQLQILTTRSNVFNVLSS